MPIRFSRPLNSCLHCFIDIEPKFDFKMRGLGNDDVSRGGVCRLCYIPNTAMQLTTQFTNALNDLLMYTCYT